MERGLLLALLLTAVAGGSLLAVTRPGQFRIGQDGTPHAGSGMTYRGSYRAGRWWPARPRQDWSRFQGRGPDGAK